MGLRLTLSRHSKKVLVQIQARSSCVVPGLFLDIPAFSSSPETCMGLTGDSKLIVGVSTVGVQIAISLCDSPTTE